ncbi:hypothetical protein Nmel_015339 [Mimus melanotis]
MAAEVDFGDRELFGQLEGEPGPPSPPAVEEPDPLLKLYQRLRDRDETELKRKLRILTRPSGISVENPKVDGPLLQILFMNNVITKNVPCLCLHVSVLYPRRYHQEIEDFIYSLVQKYEEQKKSEQEKSHLNAKPQPSSVVLEEDCKGTSSSSAKKVKEAFSPRNAARINEKRKEFLEACGGDSGNQNFQQRYHAEEVEERFGKFKPGVISGVLQDALGVTDKSLPPFIYRMRQLGYPPGWLKEAEMEHSGLALYDGKGEVEGEDGCSPQPKRITYDVSKLVNYPGFNISTPSGIPDEWQMFGSIPMQPSQQKDVFAHYLSNFQEPSPKSSSKRAAPQSKSHHSKRPREESSEIAAADMDLDSDLEGAQRSQTPNSFQFQPPLPPGSPSMSTPPPVPRGTPPLTPPQPSTPTHSPLSRTAPAADSASESPQPKIVDSVMDEDTLTLEELEEQQRLIWAALEQAESTNSDSDIPADTPLTGNSLTSSPARNEADLVTEVTEKVISVETEFSDISEQIPENERSLPSPSLEDSLLDLKENPDNAVSESLLDDTLPAPNPEVNEEENTGGDKVPTSTGSSVKKSGFVPDMSKFAAGITPFEFENMAESTGVYLRIRSLLKNSPRNQQKKKT